MIMNERQQCRSVTDPEAVAAGNMMKSHITVITGWRATKVSF